MAITPRRSQAVAALLNQHLDFDAEQMQTDDERTEMQARVIVARDPWQALTVAERRLAMRAWRARFA
jgi:hypothetical protein